MPNSAITDADRFFNIFGSMLPSTADRRDVPYIIPKTAKTDSPAATRLLWRIREDMPVISTPMQMDAAMGSRGILPIPSSPVR